MNQLQRRPQRLLAHHRRGLALHRLLGGLLAQLELQAPAVVADLGFAPRLQRPDLGEARAQLHRDQPLLGLLAEADHRVQRRVPVQLRIVRGELHHVGQFVSLPRERAVETERHRPVGHKLQRVVIDLHRRAFLGAARHQAHRRELALARLAQPDVVGPRQAAAHQDAAAGCPNVRVVRRAARHRQIQLAVLQNLGTPAVPAAHHVGHALAQNLRNEESAVEQDGVGRLARGLQERVQVPRDGRVGNVGQAQFAEQAALLVLWRLPALAERQKTLQRQFQRLFAQNRALERTADQRRSRAGDGDVRALQLRVVEQPFLGRRALAAQPASLANRELRVELGLHQPRKREIQVVAAQ